MNHGLYPSPVKVIARNRPRRTLRISLAWGRAVILRLEAVVGRCAYNYVLHTTPFDTTAAAHYHWNIEIVPSLTRTAGFELGTGWYINLVVPEESARRLREAKIEP
jgi:UDPglucose--hexose-1-phosphate uridylyltransferase